MKLSPAEAAELARMNVGTQNGDGRPRVIKRLTPTATPGFYDLQPGPYVGRFELLSGRLVEVAGRFRSRTDGRCADTGADSIAVDVGAVWLPARCSPRHLLKQRRLARPHLRN